MNIEETSDGDEDDGIAEARRRLQELEDDPSAGVTWEEVKREIGR